MKFLGILALLFLCSLSFAQTFPDAPAPQPKTWEAAHGKPATLFSYRTNWADPPLRSNKKVFKSPVFLMSSAALWTSMIVACRNSRSGEAFHSEAGAMAGMNFFMWLTDRYMSEAYSPALAAYAAQHYIRADLQ